MNPTCPKPDPWDDPKIRREIIANAVKLALLVHGDALKDLAKL